MPSRRTLPILAHECGQALRNLIRAPRFSLVVIATLALAVGGTGALLSVFNALVVRRLAVPEPDRLVTVFPTLGEARLGINAATLAELRAQQMSFTDLCGVTLGASSVEFEDGVVSRRAELITGPCYQVLGVQPFLGRLLDERDAPVVGTPASVVVISHTFWRTAFGADPGILGRTIRAEGQPLTIVGVTPEAFSGFNADEAPDLTIPSPLPFTLAAIGRLRDDVTLAAADAQIRTIWPPIWAAANPVPAGQRLPPAASADSLRVESIGSGFSTLRQRYADPLSVLLGLSALLCLLAAVNVGGLCLARAMARRGEASVRMMLGASWRRVGVQWAAESVWLAGGAAVMAIPMAWWLSGILPNTMWTGSRPLTLDVTPRAQTFLEIAGATLAMGLIASVPAVALLWFWGRGAVGTRQSRTVTAPAARWQRTILVAQVTVSLVLVFCAGLFAQNLAAIRAIAPGYQVDGLRWTRLELPYGQPRDIVQVAYFQPLIDAVAGLPNVTDVALASGFPTTERRFVAGLTTFFPTDGAPGSGEVGAHGVLVSPGFFTAVGIPLAQGRELAWTDGAVQPEPAVVNRAFASHMFPDGGALGRVIGIAGSQRTFTLVGIVENATPGDLRIVGLPIVYTSLFQSPTASANPVLVLRMRDDTGLGEQVRGTVESFGRHRVAGLQTMEDQQDRLLKAERVLSGVSSSFGGLSLLVSALGLYAVLAYGVARRTRELGVRLALGATAAHLLRLVMGEGMRLTLLGILLGIPLALAAGRALSGLLFDYSSDDPVVLAAAAGVLLVVAVTASAWPARRAARIPPSEALRAE